MTDKEIIKGLQAVNEHIGKHFNDGGAWMAEFIDNAIKALEQQPITWIVGKDNCQVAVRNMPIDKMQKICAIIGEEEPQPCEDAISRTEAIENFASWYGYDYDNQGYYRLLKQMSSVTPSYNSIKTELKPSRDCISREEALKVMCDKCPMYNCVTGCSSYRHIEKMPSVQPQPKRGKWKPVVDKTGHWVWECDDCEWQQRFATNYCPDCGADMRGEEV